ncbi:hypothetical protein [Amycolatopsis anabasis]|uniref:hypothetical protein n=1 Tax=Amycolatopsis anabasis TaxID=1840409 RepID=UPI00131B9F8B|nr:hypothetical protein [Amycolatopsis anabasis]
MRDLANLVRKAAEAPEEGGEMTIDQVAESVTRINARVGAVPVVQLQLQLAPVLSSCRRQGGYQSWPELRPIAADALALGARLAFETRDDSTSASLYAEATEIAGRSSDPQRRAEIGTSRAMVTLHATGDLSTSGTIAEAAIRDANRCGSYAVRARAFAVHAEIRAREGRAESASSGLDQAWRAAERRSPSRGFNAGPLHGFEGVCALHLGDADRAHRHLERSAATLRQPRDAIQRAIVSADLALARLRLGDPDASAEVLHEVVDIAARTGGRVPVQRLRQVRGELRPWRAEAFLADLDDHIHDTLLGG